MPVKWVVLYSVALASNAPRATLALDTVVYLGAMAGLALAWEQIQPSDGYLRCATRSGWEAHRTLPSKSGCQPPSVLRSFDKKACGLSMFDCNSGGCSREEFTHFHRSSFVAHGELLSSPRRNHFTRFRFSGRSGIGSGDGRKYDGRLSRRVARRAARFHGYRAVPGLPSRGRFLLDR